MSNRSNKPSRVAPERVAKILIAVYAAGTLISGFAWLLSPLRGHRGLTWWESTFSLLNIPVTHTLLSAVVMALITTALIRRKRIALYVTMAFQVLGTLWSVLSFIYHVQVEVPNELFTSLSFYNPILDAFSAVWGVFALVVLAKARGSFPAKVHRTSWLGAALTLLIGVVITVGAIWLFAPTQGLLPWQISLHTLGLAPSPVQRNHHGFWVLQLASTLLGITLLLAAIIFLRSPARETEQTAWNQEREVQLRALLQEFGGQDSLEYFATRREKSLVFSPDGQAAVAFRVINSVCLASGDPVGKRSSCAAAVAEWKAHARENGWVVAALSVSEDGARVFADSGLSIVTMGDEAILSADRFSLNNTSLTEVRHAVNRLRKAGLNADISYHADLTEAERSEMLTKADAWRHGATERGFSMALGRLGDPADSRSVLVVARDSSGAPVGLLSFVPWGKTGLSLDVMRRSPEAPNGVVEFMVAELMEAAADFGISRVSLNFAMFREVFASAEKFGASPLTRLASSTLGVLDRFLQLERLYTFNQKFAPEWLPRYLATDSTVSLAQVATAAGIAEGFLPAWFDRAPREPRSLDDAALAQVREIERRRVEAGDLEPRWSDQTKHRIRHLRALEAAGMSPYPLGLRARFTVEQLQEFATAVVAPWAAVVSLPSHQITVAGRVRSLRIHGGVVFVTLVDGAFSAQVVCERSSFEAENYGLLRANLDTGDIAAFTGLVGVSRNGTGSLLATSWTMAAKALHPIPFTDFSDPEARLRRRSTDLLVNLDQVSNLKVRSATISSIRKTLDSDGFTEVETPILNTVHGGASARPFKTFINAYGADLTLRIAPELYLKRLVVGGMGAVYELGRDFRNEGADATHNPEFTVLEAYKPYADYTTMRLLTEMLIKNAAYEVFGEEVLPLGAKNSTERVLTDVSGPWKVRSVLEALSEAVGFEVSLETDFEVLLRLARENEIHVRDDMGPGAVIEELYGELVEANTVEPTFYTDFPEETSPLAGPHRSKPGLVERWDLVINGMEIGTAYSEMANALQQRKRLTEQSLKAASGDLEAMQIDEDFLYALETGMPPTGGLGIGVDRLVMLLTQTQIRGVLAFPFVKPSNVN